MKKSLAINVSASLFLISSSLLSPANSVAAQDIGKAFPLNDAGSLTNTNSLSGKVKQFPMNFPALQLLLKSGSALISLPLPNGTEVTFKLTTNSVLSPELRAKYPNIQTFSGTDINNSKNTGRFDIGAAGFHAEFQVSNELIRITPTNTDSSFYKVYFAKDLPSKGVKESSILKREMNLLKQKFMDSDSKTSATSPDKLKKFRIAISSSGEFADLSGGTKEKSLSNVASLLNRMDKIYVQDVGVTFELVGKNDEIVYTDKDSDPYENDGTTDIIDAVNTINEVIGADGFDLGMLLNTNPEGGYAPGSVCDSSDYPTELDYSSNKAASITNIDYAQPDNTLGDFNVSVLAHEVAHMFGANHSFNSCADSSGSRAEGHTYEVGSGVTIMSYDGSCGATNVGDDNLNGTGWDENTGYWLSSQLLYFHSHSIDEMNTFLDKESCSTLTDSSNTAVPVITINSAEGKTIPANTPFMLSGTATDADSDTLQYSWEQFDVGQTPVTTAEELGDDGTDPIFINWPLVSTGDRYFPRLEDVIDGETVKGEYYPTTTRELNFRLVARDVKGGVSYKDYKLNVTKDAGPFKVNTPTASSSLEGNSTFALTWDVASTNTAPVNCNTVTVSFMESATSTAETVISGLSNNGSANIVLPNKSADAGYLKLACDNNVFYALSPVFKLTASENSGSETAANGKPIYDFNGDGYADILYRSTTDLKWRMDLHNSNTVNESIAVSGMSSCCGWLFNGAGDFNKDGYTDVIIRNTQSGQWYIYNLNKGEMVSRGYVPIESAVYIGVQAVADFNNDGYADVLLRNENTGEWTMTLLQNRTVLQEYKPPMSQVLSWNIVDAKDFDGNGSDDILIRNTSSGAWYVYLYDGTDISTRGYISTLTDDLSNEIKGVADFDGDGKFDVLFRNKADNSWTMSFMNGRTPKETVSVSLPDNASLDFNSADDYNGDGKADVTLINRTTNKVYLYAMDGNTISSTTEVTATVPTDYKATTLIDWTNK